MNENPRHPSFPLFVTPNDYDEGSSSKSAEVESESHHSIEQLPISEIPYTRQQIENEFSKFTNLISEQKAKINNSLLILGELQNEAYCQISDKSKIYYDLFQFEDSIQESQKRLIDPKVEKEIEEQLIICHKDFQDSAENNVKIYSLIKENEQIEGPLENRTKALSSEHKELLSKLAATVPPNLKTHIISLNNSMDAQNHRLEKLLSLYQKRIQEKDNLIANLRAQLGEDKEQQLTPKKERLRRPELIKRHSKILTSPTKEGNEIGLVKQSSQNESFVHYSPNQSAKIRSIMQPQGNESDKKGSKDERRKSKLFKKQ